MTPEQQILIETRVGNEQKSVAVAYILWLFLGLFSAHRFYLGKPLSAILQILSFFILVGFIWLIVDAFLIPGMISKHRDELRLEFRAQQKAFA